MPASKYFLGCHRLSAHFNLHAACEGQASHPAIKSCVEDEDPMLHEAVHMSGFPADRFCPRLGPLGEGFTLKSWHCL